MTAVFHMDRNRKVRVAVNMRTMTTPTDIGEAFAMLRVPLGAYLRKQVRDPVAAEDLLQQVFVKALATQDSGRVVDNFIGWLYTVARTTAIDYHRSNRLTSTEFTDDIAAPAEEDDKHLQEELASCLRPFVETLPAIYRDTLIAIDFQEKTARTVAENEGLSISAIKSRSSRGRRLLKARLLECCRVEVGNNGAILDYERRKSGCCNSTCS